MSRSIEAIGVFWCWVIDYCFMVMIGLLACVVLVSLERILIDYLRASEIGLFLFWKFMMTTLG